MLNGNIISLSKKDVDLTQIDSITLNSKELNLVIKYKNKSKEVFNYEGVEDLLTKDFNYLTKVLCNEGGVKFWKIE